MPRLSIDESSGNYDPFQGKISLSFLRAASNGVYLDASSPRRMEHFA